MLFLHISNWILPEQKQTNFSLQTFLGWGTFSFKFELNLSSYIQWYVPSKFIAFCFPSFCNTIEIAITSLDSLEMWSTIRVYLHFDFCRNRIKKNRILKISNFFCNFLPHLQVKTIRDMKQNSTLVNQFVHTEKIVFVIVSFNREYTSELIFSGALDEHTN